MGKTNSAVKQITKILLSVIIVGIFARFSYNLNIGDIQIPITGQTFALFFIAWYLLPLETIIVAILYLSVGGLGLPVFEDGASGWSHLDGVTAGYLWAYIPASALVSHLSKRKKEHSIVRIFLILFIASLLVLLIGSIFLTLKIYDVGMLIDGWIPFLPGAMIKSAMSAVLIRLIYKVQLVKSE